MADGSAYAKTVTTLGDANQPLRVLVVDDSPAQRRVLASSLKRWGYQVTEAGSGQEALTHCRGNPVDLVLSDWMMPGMSGLELCRAFRGLKRDRYGYFILLTSKTDKADVAAGLDEGADDFLTKPFNSVELRARLAAGERIVRMQEKLAQQRDVISTALSKLQTMNAELDRDLVEERKLQQSLVRDSQRTYGASHLSLFLRPCGHVGGDLVGAFPIGKQQLGVYGIDVSGHGITSALLTARIAGAFSEGSPSQNVALREAAAGQFVARPVDEVAARLNAMALDEMDTDAYFTLLYAVLDLGSGKLDLVQAGHPHPLIQRADGLVEFVGAGGMPIGLLPDVTYEPTQVQLSPGDRLMLYSDGVTECENPDGQLLDEDGLQDFIASSSDAEGTALIDGLMTRLTDFAGGAEFSDDVSLALLEFQNDRVGQTNPMSSARAR